MRRKHRPEEPLHYDRWLVSYADFITLLFAFFVVLYASSQVDKAKAAKLASSIQAAFRDVGVESTPEEISPLTELQVPPEASERSIDLGHFVQPVKSSTAADEETKSLSEAETQLKKVLSPEIEQHIVDIKSTREGVVVSLREVGFTRAVPPSCALPRRPRSIAWRVFCSNAKRRCVSRGRPQCAHSHFSV